MAGRIDGTPSSGAGPASSASSPAAAPSPAPSSPAAASSPAASSPAPSATQGRPAAFRAVRRVANYLRTLGLSDRARVRELSHRIVLDVAAEDPEQHAALAVAAAQARFATWLAALELPEGASPLWLRAFIGAHPELFLGDPERAHAAAAHFGDPLAGRPPRRASFRPQSFEPAQLPQWLRGLLPALALTLFASHSLWRALASDGFSWLELAWLSLFALLFCQAAIGLSNAALGFVLRRRERRAAAELASAAQGSEAPPARAASGEPLPRTALLMPIYHENAEDVFAALAGMREALAALPGGESFEVFVLSDSRDAQICADEERAFRRVAASSATVPIYYHRRAHNERQKAGNLAEFFERWAPRYEYAVTLDADSIMTAECLIELVRRIHADPELGLLQAPIALHRGETLFARTQAFAASVCGPNFTRGLAAWSGNCGNYYGHNAVLRVGAFLDCCELPRLNGEPPFGGHVLSHDFVEAALLCRAGWHVRSAADLTLGSYEELPPTLTEYVARDQRWCQGNLQHLLIARMRGFRAMSRVHLLLGAFAYLAGPLWFAFVAIGVLLWRNTGPGFVHAANLIALSTLAVLLGPWLLGAWDTASDAARRRAHGGRWRIARSAVLGAVLGALLAPLLMLHHTRIVLSILTGRAVSWGAQRRHATSELIAVAQAELPATLLGLTAAALAVFEPAGPWRWLSPVWLPWLLSIPLHASVSSGSLGSLARRSGWLVIPSESEPEPLLARIDELRAFTRSDTSARFRDLVLDPVLLAAHLEHLGDDADPGSQRGLELLRARALQEGPLSLSPAEWRRLAQDRESMRELHREAWQHWPVESWDLGREEPRLPPDGGEAKPDAPASSSPAHAERLPSSVERGQGRLL
jgi:membrane glycosyltransferase